MPQIEHLPGSDCVKVGCMGQTHALLAAGGEEIDVGCGVAYAVFDAIGSVQLGS